MVKHFSDTVQYDVHGFLEKNRDTVSKELVNVVAQSEMDLCKQLMELEETDTLSEAKTTAVGGRVVISASKQTVSLSFKIFVLKYKLLVFSLLYCSLIIIF